MSYERADIVLIGEILAIVLVLMLFVPLIITVVWAISKINGIVGQIDWENLAVLLLRSVLLSGMVGVLSVAIGGSLGFFLYKVKLRSRQVLKLLMIVPLLLPPYIYAVAYTNLFWVFVGTMRPVESFWGAVLILSTVYVPLSMLIIGSGFERINYHLEEAGLMAGSRWIVMRKILIPLLKPWIYSSFILTFILAISNFSVPAFLGVKLFTTEIFTQFSAFYNHSLAIVESLVLVVVGLLLLFGQRKFLHRAPFFAVGTKGNSIKLWEGKILYVLGTLWVLLWFVIFDFLPLMILVFHSFGDGEALSRAWHLLEPAMWRSLVLALLGGIVIVFVGFFAGYMTKLGQMIDWALLIMFALPSVTLGISLIKAYNNTFLEFIYSSFVIIVLGYVGRFGFIGSKLIGNGLSQIPQSLEEVAIVMGISRNKRLESILFPLILPAVAAAFVIGFILSFGELGVSIMVYPPGSQLVPIKIFTIMPNSSQDLTNAMVSEVLIIMLILVGFLYFGIKKIFKFWQKKVNFSKQ